VLDEKRIKMVKRVVYIIFGSFIYSCGINALFLPHNLYSGGLTGIAMFIEYYSGIPTAFMVPILNIPLFIGGYKFVSKRFAYLSIVGIGSMSIFLTLTKGFVIPVENSILAAIFGGLITGAGIGIVLKNRGSLGGTDIISVIINKYFSFSIGGIATAFNSIILILAALQFDIEIAMLTMIGLFINNKTLDAIQEGFNHKKTLFIISDKSEDMAEQLFRHVRRGVTFLEGEGAYTHKNKKLIYMVVRTMELAKVKDIVRSVDPNAFMTISDTKEVEGKGFDIGDLF